MFATVTVVMFHDQSEWTQDTRAGGRSHWFTPFCREVPGPSLDGRSPATVAGEAYVGGREPSAEIIYAVLAEWGIAPHCVAWRVNGPVPAEADIPTHWRRAGAEIVTSLAGFKPVPQLQDAPWVRLPERFRERCIVAFEQARPTVSAFRARRVTGGRRSVGVISILAIGEELVEPWANGASRPLWAPYLRIEGPPAKGAVGEDVWQEWHITPPAVGWIVDGSSWLSSGGHRIEVADRQAWATWSNVPAGCPASMVQRFAPGTARRLDAAAPDKF